MRIFFTITTLFLLSFYLLANEKAISSEEFLARARTPSGTSSYAKLSGSILHLDGKDNFTKRDVYLGILITPDGSKAQLVINDEEVHIILHNFNLDGTVTNKTTTNISENENSIVKSIGLNPSDLTTGFLFYNFIKEEQQTYVKGQVCRVLLLEAPDKSEVAKAYISESYYFPLKVDFFESLEEVGKVPQRTMSVGSFKKQNDLYYTEMLSINGRNWRTRIYFRNAEVGIPNTTNIADLFKKIKLDPEI